MSVDTATRKIAKDLINSHLERAMECRKNAIGFIIATGGSGSTWLADAKWNEQKAIELANMLAKQGRR